MNAHRRLLLSLAPYVTEEDAALDRCTFLLNVRDRIADDVPGLADVRAAYTDLHDAARAVVDAWEDGDLAAAVRELANLIEVNHVR